MIDRIQDLESAYESQSDVLRERALEIAAVAREQFSRGTEMVRDYIVKEPVRALGIALGVGVLLGWLIKRR